MGSIDSPHVVALDEALATWTDERFCSRAGVRALLLFHEYLVNLAEDGGWSYDGHSYKPGAVMGTLVVKAYIDGAPMVVFTSARTTTGCVLAFIRKLELGLLEWRDDRYRQ